MRLVKSKPVNPAINNLAIIDTSDYWGNDDLKNIGAHFYNRSYDYYNRTFKGDPELGILYEAKHHELPFSLIHRLQGEETVELRKYLKAFRWDGDAKELFQQAIDQHKTVQELRVGKIETIQKIFKESGIDPNTFIRRSKDCEDQLLDWYNRDEDGLYPAMRLHQLVALSLYITCKFSNNWGQMRTGKTPPTLIYLYWLLATNQIDLALIVVPNSIKKIWYNELPKDLPGEMQGLTDIIQGTKTKKRELWNAPGFIKIVSYSTLRADIDTALEVLNGKRFLLVADEAHNIKNPDAKATQAFRQLEPSFFVALSGTPVANKPHDVVSPVNITAPVLMTRSFKDFRTEYCHTGGPYASIVSYKKGALEEVNYRLQKISVAARRKEIGVGFGKIVQPIELEMSEAMTKVHKQIRDDLIVELLSSDGWTALKVNGFLAKLARLQQACGGYLPEFDMLGDATGNVIWFDDKDNAKLTWLDNFIMDFLDDIEKVVIFSRFIPVIKKLYKRYKPYGAVYICGEVKPDDRVDRVNQFREDENTRVLIVNIDIAAGFDMNPAQFAIFYERTFYLMPNEQAEDRITGINQVGDSTIMPLVCKGSIDQSLEYEVLPKKRAWAAKTMGLEVNDADLQGGGVTITKDDLFALLNIDKEGRKK